MSEKSVLPDEGDEHTRIMERSASCVLVAGAFACVTSWGIFQVFSPALALLSFAQRVTVPLLVATVLLVPFFGDAGRIACGAVGVGAFAYVTLMEWTDSVVSNAEFQLYPVKRHAFGRLAKWSGFTAGAIVAYAAFYALQLSDAQLMLLASVVAVAVVAAFAAYAANSFSAQDKLLGMLTDAEEELVIDPPKNAAPFRERCDALARKYHLTNRETQVFVYLAKGRNSEYIQQKLFISANAVCTHIFHIYKKMGISSQQRLIDLVDERNSQE